MNQELLRIVDALARDKNIDKETMFEDLEAAMVSAIRKANAQTDDIVVRINRQSGDITASVNAVPMSVRDLGRIAAQTAKQVMIQRIRAAERDSLYEEYLDRRGEIVTGRVARWEGGSLVIDLGRVEAVLPKSEQIPGDSHQVEERIRAMILDVKEQPSQVKIVLSRTHPDFIRALFELEVPEVAEKIIDIKALARLPLRDLDLARTEVYDLSPLRGMTLSALNLSGTRLRDLGAVAAMKVRNLDVSGTDIRDLAALRGQPLERLNLQATRVSDLSPLQGVPLRWLDISGTEVADLRPLQQLPLEDLWLDDSLRRQLAGEAGRAFGEVLERMPRLARVNGAAVRSKE